MKLHDKLFELRKKANLTQNELAERLEVSRQTISKWEMGTSIPDISNILAISRALNVTVDYLINDDTVLKTDSVVNNITKDTTKLKQKVLLKRIIVALGMIFVLAVITIVTHSYTSVAVITLNLCFLAIIWYVVRLLKKYYFNTKDTSSERR